MSETLIDVVIADDDNNSYRNVCIMIEIIYFNLEYHL